MSCGGGEDDRWTCGKAGVAVNLQRVSSIVRDIGEPCLSQSPIKVSVPANKMLKPDKWHATFDSDGKIFCFQKALKRIFLGGVDPSIRPEVWEFLLGCYALESTADYRRQLRTARREHYENLIKQCQMMHSSIGTGSLAYVVGSKVMDMRAPSKDIGVRESNGATREASVDNSNRVESNCCSNYDTKMSSSYHSESSGDSDDLVSVRESAKNAAYDSSFFIATSGSQNCNTLNVGREADGSRCVNESYFDFPSLPVTDLFGKSEEDKKEVDMQDGILSQQNLRFKDDKMHSFQINNNVDLVIESNTSPSNSVSRPSNVEIEMACADVSEPELQSNNIDKKTEIVNRMRISDVPETDFIDGTLTRVEALSKDRVSEWLWTLHRIVVDVVRTDSHLEFYENTRNLARMSDILAVYAWVDPATGYCQGMSDLLSPFIVLFEDDADAFWCFEMLLRRMRENFQMEGPTGVMKQLQALWHILELTDREMFSHLSHIGAESLHFAFRMLLVLFRRELTFNEALCMWEMMWAADFHESLVSDLEENCLEALMVHLPRDSEAEMRDESVESGSVTTKGSLQSNHGNFDCSMSMSEIGIKSASTTTHHFCGLTRNFWTRNDSMQIWTAVSSTKKGDDELPVFCVAAILIMNRQKIIRETRSIDDMIKIFNDKMLKINVKRCVHMAIKLRKKYFYKKGHVAKDW
ncbi:Rab-GTPase-TBC domain containing protein [Trema orientale]|uniref:Rab-GTPase-TBC domain containing protein n=1 Tax=Trema orientale TaxID=63057 RepID=A0A2P5G0K4_TREOI|nr:Rab-GTPase-TBC domain containing protein [Trema orientale]